MHLNFSLLFYLLKILKTSLSVSYGPLVFLRFVKLDCSTGNPSAKDDCFVGLWILSLSVTTTGVIYSLRVGTIARSRICRPFTFNVRGSSILGFPWGQEQAGVLATSEKSGSSSLELVESSIGKGVNRLTCIIQLYDCFELCKIYWGL